MMLYLKNNRLDVKWNLPYKLSILLILITKKQLSCILVTHYIIDEYKKNIQKKDTIMQVKMV